MDRDKVKISILESLRHGGKKIGKRNRMRINKTMIPTKTKK